MVVWMVGGLGAALIVALMLLRVRSYRRLFADEHFLEIAAAIASLKAAALERVIHTESDRPTSPSDPRILMTRSGLALVYTVAKRENDFVHHWSVSLPGAITANAVGSTFATFVIKMVGLPLASMRFEIAASTVHHGEATLSPTDHQRLAGSPVAMVSAANVAAFRRACDEARRTLSWKGVNTRAA